MLGPEFQDIVDSDVDQAQLSTSIDQVGGIDFNDIELNRQSTGVNIEFDPNALQQIFSSDIDGFKPVIMNITPVPSIFPILGLDPITKEEDQELLSAVR